MSTVPHVVVIGGGFGGLDAARTLAGEAVKVTLIDRHNYHLFQPLLYQVATASLSPGDIASPIRWILRHQQNATVLLADARAIDPVDRRVMLDRWPLRGRARVRSRRTAPAIAYDYLVVATGAAHAYFGHPEWAARAPGLKTLDDALEIRRRVLLAFEAAERETDPLAQRRLLTFVIVGGGPTGVELAGALAEIARRTLREDFRHIKPESARIVLVEGGPHLLATFPESLRARAQQSLTDIGVEVLTGSIVTTVDEEGVRWRAAGAPADAATERIAAQTVLWAAGVAASPLATIARRRARSGGPREGRARLSGFRDGRRSLSSATSACCEQDGKPLPGRGAGRQAGGCARGP